MSKLSCSYQLYNNLLFSLANLGIKIKMGSWSKKEIETLEKNMEEYLLVRKLVNHEHIRSVVACPLVFTFLSLDPITLTL